MILVRLNDICKTLGNTLRPLREGEEYFRSKLLISVGIKARCNLSCGFGCTNVRNSPVSARGVLGYYFKPGRRRRIIKRECKGPAGNSEYFIAPGDAHGAEYDDNGFQTTSKKSRGSVKVKRYKCNVCGLMCSSPSVLEGHMRTHTGEKPYKCPVCDYRCAQTYAVKAHMRIHTGERPFSCSECDFRCAHSTGLKVHMRTHTGEKPYACTICDYRCAVKPSLKAHMLKHTNSKPYKCSTCDYRCSTPSLLKLHSYRHSKLKPYKCSYCDYACTMRTQLNSHVRIHTGEKPYSCDFCDYKSRLRSSLQYHMRLHTGEKGPRLKHACRYCEYSTASASSLKIHMRSHTGEKPYACRYCDYKATQQGVLKVHERLHTGEKPYTCKMCEKKFISLNYLKDHMKSHSEENLKPFPCFLCDERFNLAKEWMDHLAWHGTGKKPFNCKLCDYTTYRKQNLNIHNNRKHIAERPWPCMLCSQAFARKSNLRRHIHVAHKDEVGDRQRALIKSARPLATIADTANVSIPSNVKSESKPVKVELVPDRNLLDRHHGVRFVVNAEGDGEGRRYVLQQVTGELKVVKEEPIMPTRQLRISEHGEIFEVSKDDEDPTSELMEMIPEEALETETIDYDDSHEVITGENLVGHIGSESDEIIVGQTIEEQYIQIEQAVNSFSDIES